MSGSPKLKGNLSQEVDSGIGCSVIQEIKEEIREPAEREKFVKRLLEQGISDEWIDQLFPEFISSSHSPP